MNVTTGPNEAGGEVRPTAQFGRLTAAAAKIDLHNSMVVPDKGGAFADISSNSDYTVIKAKKPGHRRVNSDSAQKSVFG